MKRGAVIGIVAGAVVVAVAGGATAWWLLTQSPGPEATARDFLQALAEGDAASAVALLDAPADDLADAYEGASAVLTDPSVGDVEGDGSSRTAAVSFILDGEDRTATFGLVQTDAGWRVAADALGTVTPTTTIGDSVRIGSALVPVAAPVTLLPAVYPVTAAPAGLLSGETTAVVLPGSTADAAVEASVAPEATAVAQLRLDAYAATCAAPATAVPSHCGMRVPWAADLGALTSIAFRIDTPPVLALSDDGRTFAASGGVLVATATGTKRDGAAGTFTYRADDWALRGTVAFTGDEMVLKVG